MSVIARDRLCNIYGSDFVFDVDEGAWHKLNEDFTGSAFNKNSIHRDSIGDMQAKLTEHYFVTLMERHNIDINVKSVEWELWDHVMVGRRIDMKSKRRNTYPPKEDYDYHVDLSQIEHPCHHYVWSDVFYNSSSRDEIPVHLAYAGWLPKSEFLEDSMLERKGDVDNRGWKARVDARKVNKFWLRDMGSLIYAADNAG